MEFFETLEKRRSIRVFKNKEIEKMKLQKILESANLSPSAGNLQGYNIVLVREPKGKDALADAAWGQNFISQAPIVLVFCANAPLSADKYGKRGEDLYSVQDATIACTYAMLAASALGLGSVWVGAFQENIVRKSINAHKGVKPIAILPLGYPAENPEPRPRRTINNLVKMEKF